MKHLLWIPIFLIAGAGCKKESAAVNNSRATSTTSHEIENASTQSDLNLVKGDWVVGYDIASPSETGSLTLNTDHTFSGKTVAKEKSLNKPLLMSLYSGTFDLSHEQVSNEDRLVVNFNITKMNGKLARVATSTKLVYNKTNDLLNNLQNGLVAVSYCRLGQVAKVKALFQAKS